MFPKPQASLCTTILPPFKRSWPSPTLVWPHHPARLSTSVGRNRRSISLMSACLSSQKLHIEGEGKKCVYTAVFCFYSYLYWERDPYLGACSALLAPGEPSAMSAKIFLHCPHLHHCNDVIYFECNTKLDTMPVWALYLTNHSEGQRKQFDNNEIES